MLSSSRFSSLLTLSLLLGQSHPHQSLHCHLLCNDSPTHILLSQISISMPVSIPVPIYLYIDTYISNSKISSSSCYVADSTFPCFKGNSSSSCPKLTLYSPPKNIFQSFWLIFYPNVHNQSLIAFCKMYILNTSEVYILLSISPLPFS